MTGEKRLVRADWGKVLGVRDFQTAEEGKLSLVIRSLGEPAEPAKGLWGLTKSAEGKMGCLLS